MKKILLLLFLVCVCTGCSKQYWVSRFYMIKAENACMKGQALKLQKMSYESRLPYYGEACRYFLKAFDLDPRIFTLNQIQEAADACWRVDDIVNRDQFREYEEEYIKKHPLENEYGDAGVASVS